MASVQESIVKGDDVEVVQKGEADALPPLESLQCHICDGYFKDAVTLPCMHSFCKECLRVYNGRPTFEVPVEEDDEDEDEEGGDGQGNPVPKKPKKKSKPFCCPTCKDTLHLDSFSFYAEPFPNDRLNRIVKLLHETKILCQNCEAHASEFRCKTCDAYTCKDCWDITHTARIFKDHSPERLTHMEMTAPPKCDSHMLNDVEYFCTEDELGVCQVCLLKGEFKGKAYSLVSDIRKQRQVDIDQGISEALLQRARLVEGRKENEDVLQALSENLNDQEKAVQENFAKIRQALDQREKETIQALKDLYEKKKSVLDSQIETIDVQKARIEDGVRNVNLVLNHSNDLEVVYLTYVLQGHVDSLTQVPSTNPAAQDSSEPNHEPAVDAELPVILSDKVPQLVSAYASVPEASIVEEIASGLKNAKDLQAQSGSKEQQQILKNVAGANVDGGEYGCIIS